MRDAAPHIHLAEFTKHLTQLRTQPRDPNAPARSRAIRIDMLPKVAIPSLPLLRGHLSQVTLRAPLVELGKPALCAQRIAQWRYGYPHMPGSLARYIECGKSGMFIVQAERARECSPSGVASDQSPQSDLCIIDFLKGFLLVRPTPSIVAPRCIQHRKCDVARIPRVYLHQNRPRPHRLNKGWRQISMGLVNKHFSLLPLGRREDAGKSITNVTGTRSIFGQRRQRRLVEARPRSSSATDLVGQRGSRFRYAKTHVKPGPWFFADSAHNPPPPLLSTVNLHKHRSHNIRKPSRSNEPD